LAAAPQILKVANLVKEFPVLAGGLLRRQVGSVHAVSDVTLSVRQGETFGWSGSRAVARHHGPHDVALEQPTAGSVHFEDSVLTDLKRSDLRRRRRDVQLISRILTRRSTLVCGSAPSSESHFGCRTSERTTSSVTGSRLSCGRSV